MSEYHFQKYLSQVDNGAHKAMQVGVTATAGRAVLSFRDSSPVFEGAKSSIEIDNLDDLRELGVMFMEAYFKARDLETATRDEEIAVIGRLLARGAKFAAPDANDVIGTTRENHDGNETEKD